VASSAEKAWPFPPQLQQSAAADGKGADPEEAGDFAGLGSPVEAPEYASSHERDSGAKREHVPGVKQAEAAYAANEQPGDGEIEEAPENIHRGGGEALSRRLGEGALKGAARDAVGQMRQGVGEERAAKEVREIVVPVHGCPLPAAKTHGNRLRWWCSFRVGDKPAATRIWGCSWPESWQEEAQWGGL